MMIPLKNKRYEEYLSNFVPEVITKQQHLAEIQKYINEIEILEQEFATEFNLVTDMVTKINSLEKLLKNYACDESRSSWDWESMPDA